MNCYNSIIIITFNSSYIIKNLWVELYFFNILFLQYFYKVVFIFYNFYVILFVYFLFIFYFLFILMYNSFHNTFLKYLYIMKKSIWKKKKKKKK